MELGDAEWRSYKRRNGFEFNSPSVQCSGNKGIRGQKVPECTAVRVVQSERAWNSVAVDEVGSSGTSAEHSRTLISF